MYQNSIADAGDSCIKFGLPLTTSPVAAFQLVAALLHEAARNHGKQSRLLLAARLEALNTLWALVNDTKPEQTLVWPRERLERRAQSRP